VGNQITRPGGISVTYTPFDLPKTITKGGKTTSFGYDGGQQRIRKVSPTAETLYFGDIFEQVTTAGVVEHRYYVHSPERAIAVVTRGGATPGTRFLHVDHLGSVDVVTKEDGSIDERRSYDAFGARRNAIWGEPSTAMTSKTTRGFTGHEEDDEFGLVNMKGRIMDPHLGRFTTTDPVIADIFDGQSLNRYSYVANNPLAFVDPTGFQSVEAEQKQRQPPPSVVHLPEDRIVGMRPPWAPKPDPLELQPTEERAKVGANAPPVDVSTTGSGGQGLPQKPTDPEPPPIAQFFEGVGEGAIEIVPELITSIILSNAGAPASSLYRAQKGDIVLDGAGERLVDTLNQVNPIYAVGVGVVDGTNAYDNGDYVGVGKATVGVTVTVVMTIITLKGAKTTRGPPGAGGTGKVYRVDGSKTASGKPYIGRTKQSSPQARGCQDGRIRSGAQIVDTYDALDSAAARRAEQQAINREGGVGKLDNRRNEVRPEKWEAHGIDPPP
ncbi:MAG TPA: RHS repeat-associated core domain-containing protein, partial [Polyangium sp.]|nr:RHS repeat-associated core domain-containing protein [Polyangium sp.]